MEVVKYALELKVEYSRSHLGVGDRRLNARKVKEKTRGKLEGRQGGRYVDKVPNEVVLYDRLPSSCAK